MCKVPEVSKESIAASGDTMTKGSGCYQPRSQCNYVKEWTFFSLSSSVSKSNEK